MAVAYEIWLGHSTKHLEAFRSSEDPKIFQYAIGIETVRAITNITDDRKLAQITFVLLDFALSHVSPSDILFKSLNFINPDNEKLFDPSDISALYRELTEQLIVPEMDEETKKLSDYVDMITNSVTKENDEFDLAIKSFTELMSSSLQLRKTEPAYICNTLLFNFHEPEFLENYHLPLYRNKNAIVDTGINSKRFDAVLFFEILFHRMLTLVDESTAKICPMYNNDICKFKRVAACKEAPWNRRFQNESIAGTQVCLYRFVEHGLENISDNNTI